MPQLRAWERARVGVLLMGALAILGCNVSQTTGGTKGKHEETAQTMTTTRTQEKLEEAAQTIEILEDEVFDVLLEMAQQPQYRSVPARSVFRAGAMPTTSDIADLNTAELGFDPLRINFDFIADFYIAR